MYVITVFIVFSSNFTPGIQFDYLKIHRTLTFPSHLSPIQHLSKAQFEVQKHSTVFSRRNGHKDGVIGCFMGGTARSLRFFDVAVCRRACSTKSVYVYDSYEAPFTYFCGFVVPFNLKSVQFVGFCRWLSLNQQQWNLLER